MVASASPRGPDLYDFALLGSAALGEHEVRVAFGTGGAKTKNATVELVGEAALALLELDKALYKPGQTIRLRALALQPPALTPLGGRRVELLVRSPQGLTLMKAENVTDDFGVAHFAYPVASEPPLGEYSARATVLGGSGGAAEETFAVEEYVLPRFEVNMSLDQPHVLAPSQDSRDGTTEITGKVSARYTFGEGVQGTALITALAPASSPYSGGMGIGAPVGVAIAPEMPGGRTSAGTGGSSYTTLGTVSGVQLLAGEAQFRLALPSKGLMAGAELLLEASVVDAATGERQNATAMLQVVYKGSELLVHLATADDGDSFRPGLPILLRAELKQPGGGTAGADTLGDGVASVVATAFRVDYQLASTTTSVKLPASRFADGQARLEVELPVDDPACCDPLADTANRSEYLAKKGCCTSRVVVHVEMDGQRLYSSALGDTPSLCLSRAYSPLGHHLAVEPPSGNASVVVMRSTTDFASFQNTAKYFAVCGGAVAAAGAVSLDGVAVAGYWKAKLTIDMPPEVLGRCRLSFVARTAEGVAVTSSAAVSRETSWPFGLTASFSTAEARPGQELEVRFEATGVSSDAAARVFFASLDRSAELLGARAAVDAASMQGALDRLRSAVPTPPAPWRSCGSHGHDAALVAAMDAGTDLLAPAAAAAPSDADVPWGKSLGEHCPRPIQDGCGPMVQDRGDVMIAFASPPGAAAESASASAPPASSEATTGGTTKAAVRKFFPETWLWADAALAASGAASARVTAPDTITSWSLEAFAVTPQGICPTRASTPLRVFKPFFVEVRLPYSAIRGEVLEVTLAVFNFASGSGSLNASVSVALPPELALEGPGSTQLQVAEGSAATARFTVRPTSLGSHRFRVSAAASGGGWDVTDAVERALLVQPEGVEKRETRNLVLELNGSAVQEVMKLPVPDSVVNGSLRGSISVVGDILGPTISGLDRLLRIPTGCGEQNMITLAPNVYVAKYLQSVGRLQPQLRQRIANNMLVGYGRELTYRHPDGSFSAFGESDKEGSTWLTAFVLKTFAEIEASGLITMDASVLEAAARWLLVQQAADGSFLARGKVIHKEMMGGVSGGTSAKADSALTSYVLAALAKARAEVPSLGSLQGLDDALARATAFLKTSDPQRAYPRLLRLVATAMAAADAGAAAASAVHEALPLSTTSPDAGGGLRRHWSAGTESQDVELTGYGVLLLSLAGRLTEAFECARWLLHQRKASGGFSSTQDTVVALNALATFAAAGAGTVDARLSVAAAGGLNATLSVEASNAEVLQSLALPSADAEVSIAASGRGIVLVVAEAVYHVAAETALPCYDIEVRWMLGVPAAKSGAVRGCAKPRPDCAVSPEGMWIMSVGLYTGYGAVASSLEARRLAGDIKRYELGDGKVDLYLERMSTSGAVCVEFNVTQDFVVGGLQARQSTVYEYYAPERAGQVLRALEAEEYTPATTTPAPTDGAPGATTPPPQTSTAGAARLTDAAGATTGPLVAMSLAALGCLVAA